MKWTSASADAVYELGNAWIAFGDLLDEQIAAMGGAQFGLINGSWMGDAAIAMSMAWGGSYGSSGRSNGLNDAGMLVVEQCWQLGESINYYAMLRNRQEAETAARELAEFLIGLFGVLLGVVGGFEFEILGLVGKALVLAGRSVGEILAGVTRAAEELAGSIGKGATAAVTALPRPLGALVSGSASVVRFGADMAWMSSASMAAGDAVAGLGVEWASPVPLNGDQALGFLVGLVEWGPLGAGAYLLTRAVVKGLGTKHGPKPAVGGGPGPVNSADVRGVPGQDLSFPFDSRGGGDPGASFGGVGSGAPGGIAGKGLSKQVSGPGPDTGVAVKEGGPPAGPGGLSSGIAPTAGPGGPHRVGVPGPPVAGEAGLGGGRGVSAGDRPGASGGSGSSGGPGGGESAGAGRGVLPDAGPGSVDAGGARGPATHPGGSEGSSGAGGVDGSAGAGGPDPSGGSIGVTSRASGGFDAPLVGAGPAARLDADPGRTGSGGVGVGRGGPERERSGSVGNTDAPARPVLRETNAHRDVRDLVVGHAPVVEGHAVEAQGHPPVVEGHAAVVDGQHPPVVENPARSGADGAHQAAEGHPGGAGSSQAGPVVDGSGAVRQADSAAAAGPVRPGATQRAPVSHEGQVQGQVQGSVARRPEAESPRAVASVRSFTPVDGTAVRVAEGSRNGASAAAPGGRTPAQVRAQMRAGVRPDVRPEAGQEAGQAGHAPADVPEPDAGPRGESAVGPSAHGPGRPGLRADARTHEGAGTDAATPDAADPGPALVSPRTPAHGSSRPEEGASRRQPGVGGTDTGHGAAGSGRGAPPDGSVAHPQFVKRTDGRHVTESDGLLDLGGGRPPAHVPAGSEGVFDAFGELRFVTTPDGGASFDRFLDGGWQRREQPGELITVKLSKPFPHGVDGVLGSEMVLDKGLRGDGDRIAEALGPDNDHLVSRLAGDGLSTAKPVAIRSFVRGADGWVRTETVVPDGEGGWRRPTSPSDVASFEAGLAAANKVPGAARRLYDIAARPGLQGLGPEELRDMLLHGSDADRDAASYAAVTRGTGKAPRGTQMAGYDALGDDVVLNMSAGEGKSLVSLMDTVRRAVLAGVDAVHVITTRDNLADREAATYREVLEPLGYTVHRMNHTGPPPAVVKGEPTVYVGTGEDVGFTYLNTGRLDGRPAADGGKTAADGSDPLVIHANVDEVDEAVTYSNTTYILSEGPERAAAPEVATSVREARDLADGMPENLLTGRPGEKAAPGGLTDAAREWAQGQVGHELSADEVHRLTMALLAKNVYKQEVHYVTFDRGDGKGERVYIVDQTTHQVMYNPKTSTQSRWNNGLAQAIEAKHSLEIRGDSRSSKEVTFKQLLGDQYDRAVGASATAHGKSALFAEGGLSRGGDPVRIVDIDRYFYHQLDRRADVVSPTMDAKVERVADDAYREHTQTGRPQVIIAHRNDLVATITEHLKAKGATDVTAIDARWTLQQGANREEAFASAVAEAGAPGRILVVNMQGARGVDIGVNAEARGLGGLHVRVTAHSDVSDDIDIQAENRAARSGDPGSVTYYTSPDDDIFQLPHDNPDVGLAIIKYRTAHEQHTADAGPGPRTLSLHDAENDLRDLIRPLQQIANELRGMDIPAYQPHGPPSRDTSLAPDTNNSRFTDRTPSHPPPSSTDPGGRPQEDELAVGIALPAGAQSPYGIALGGQPPVASAAASGVPGMDESVTRHEIGSVEVYPPTQAAKEAGGHAAPAAIRRFAVNRGELRRGEVVVGVEAAVVIRLHLHVEKAPEPDRDLRPEELTDLQNTVAAGLGKYFGEPGHRLENGDLLSWAVEFVRDEEQAHHIVQVSPDASGHYRVTAWYPRNPGRTGPTTLGHEGGHLAGLQDEYRQLKWAGAGVRPGYEDGSLMGFVAPIEVMTPPEDLPAGWTAARLRLAAFLATHDGDAVWSMSPDGSRTVVARAEGGDDVTVEVTIGTDRRIASYRLVPAPPAAPAGSPGAHPAQADALDAAGLAPDFVSDLVSSVNRALARHMMWTDRHPNWTVDGVVVRQTVAEKYTKGLERRLLHEQADVVMHRILGVEPPGGTGSGPGVGHVAYLSGDQALQVLSNWPHTSSVAGRPRPPELHDIDSAVGALSQSLNAAALVSVMRAVSTWKAANSQQSADWQAVSDLESAAYGIFFNVVNRDYTAVPHVVPAAAPSASVPQAVHPARFPDFFSGPSRLEYLDKSAEYGRATARTLGSDPYGRRRLDRALQELLRRYYMTSPGGFTEDLLHQLGGDGQASVVDARAGLRGYLQASRTDPLPFDELMGRFERAVPEYARRMGLAAPVGVQPRGATWDAAMRERGYLGSADLTAEQLQQARDIELMLRVHQHLGPQGDDVFTFREAVAGWYLSRPGALPWEWFLDTSHRVGVWDQQVEPDPWRTDLSRVHGWIQGQLDPLERATKQHSDQATLEAVRYPPHVTMYEERTRSLLSGEVTGRGDWVDPVSFVHNPLGTGPTGSAAAPWWSLRGKALRSLLRDPAMLETLDLLATAHSMALALVAGPDSVLLQSGVLMGPGALDRLRELVRAVGRRAGAGDRASWPLLMLRDPGIRGVVDRSAPKADIDKAVDDFAEAVGEPFLAEVRRHGSMAVEALDMLPSRPADSSAALYTRVGPGPLFGKPAFATGMEMHPEALSTGNSVRATALQTLKLVVRQGQSQNQHPVLIEQVRSYSLRDVSFWSWSGQHQGKAVSPVAMALQVVDAKWAKDETTGLWYEHVLVTEKLRPTSSTGWDNEFLVRDVRTPQGEWLGFGNYNARDTAIFTPTLRHMLDMTHLRIYGKGIAKDQFLGHWPLPGGHDPAGKPSLYVSAAHGSPNAVTRIGRFGRKIVNGSADGVESARRMAEAGAADATPLVQFVCNMGTARPGLPTVAQQAADEHPQQRVLRAANTVLAGMPTREDYILLHRSWGSTPAPGLLRFTPANGFGPAAPAPSAEPYLAGQAAGYPGGALTWVEGAKEYDAALGTWLASDTAALHLMRRVIGKIGAAGTYQVPADLRRLTVPQLVAVALGAAQGAYPDVAYLLGVSAGIQRLLRDWRGIHHDQGTVPNTEVLYRLYRDLDLPSDEFPSFVKAVFAWGLSEKHPLAALLRGLHLSGISRNQAVLTAALVGNGAHLYGLVDTMFETGAGPAAGRPEHLRLPHWRQYTRGMSYIADDHDGIRVPDDLMRAVRLLSSAVKPPERPAAVTQSAENWAARHAAARASKAEGRPSPVERLDPAHVVALYLLSDDASRVFLESGAERLPADQGSALLAGLVRQAIGEAFDRAAGGGGLELPLLLRHPRLREQLSKVQATGPAPASAQLDELRRQMLDQAPALAGELRLQLPFHLGLVAEGLERLPPVDRRVYYALAAPGQGVGAELREVDLRARQQVFLDRDEALSKLDQGDAHRILVVVEKSSARDHTVLAKDPSGSQVRYGEPTRLVLKRHTVVTTDGGGSYEELLMEELPSVDPQKALDAVKGVAAAAGDVRPSEGGSASHGAQPGSGGPAPHEEDGARVAPLLAAHLGRTVEGGRYGVVHDPWAGTVRPAQAADSGVFGLRGRWNSGARNVNKQLKDQQTTAYVMPSGSGSGRRHEDPSTDEHTPSRVLDHGVVDFLDVTGLPPAAELALTDLTGSPQATSDQQVDKAARVHARIREVLSPGHGYKADESNRSGLVRDTPGAVDIKGTMGRAVFAFATDDPIVPARIKLVLSTVTATDTTSHGPAAPLLDVTAGGGPASHDPAVGQAESSVNRSSRHYRSAADGVTGGREHINVTAERVYAYEVPVDFVVSSPQEERGTFRSDNFLDTTEVVRGRCMRILIPESEALKEYAKGALPISDEQLLGVVRRWEDGTLELPGDTMAGVLLRWKDNPGYRVEQPALAPTADDLERVAAVIRSAGTRPRSQVLGGVDARLPGVRDAAPGLKDFWNGQAGRLAGLVPDAEDAAVRAARHVELAWNRSHAADSDLEEATRSRQALAQRTADPVAQGEAEAAVRRAEDAVRRAEVAVRRAVDASERRKARLLTLNDQVAGATMLAGRLGGLLDSLGDLAAGASAEAERWRAEGLAQHAVDLVEFAEARRAGLSDGPALGPVPDDLEPIGAAVRPADDLPGARALRAVDDRLPGLRELARDLVDSWDSYAAQLAYRVPLADSAVAVARDEVRRLLAAAADREDAAVRRALDAAERQEARLRTLNLRLAAAGRLAHRVGAVLDELDALAGGSEGEAEWWRAEGLSQQAVDLVGSAETILVGLPTAGLLGQGRDTGAFTVYQGEDFVRLTQRVHLVSDDVDDDEAARVREELVYALDGWVNAPGRRVPGDALPGPRLEIDVEFVGSREAADRVVMLFPGAPGAGRTSTSSVWYADAGAAANARAYIDGLDIFPDFGRRPLPEKTDTAGVTERIPQIAGKLAELHRAETREIAEGVPERRRDADSPILDADLRERFNAAFLR